MNAVAVAILWLGICVLSAQGTPRQREICMIGTCVLLALIWVTS